MALLLSLSFRRATQNHISSHDSSVILITNMTGISVLRGYMGSASSLLRKKEVRRST